MDSTEPRKTLIQCDFDGTITEEDVSFMLLDTFATGDWRQLLQEYKEGKMSLGQFNTKAFAMVKADRQSLLEATKGWVRIRAGFRQMVAYCRERGFRLVIVSNGLDFYIEAILTDIGVEGIEVFATKTQFLPQGLRVQYIAPDGSVLDKGFKDAHVNLFLKSGYRVIYIGNGTTDISPAGQCHYIFATGQLLDYCSKTNLNYTDFTDFNDVVRGLELL